MPTMSISPGRPPSATRLRFRDVLLDEVLTVGRSHEQGDWIATERAGAETQRAGYLFVKAAQLPAEPTRYVVP